MQPDLQRNEQVEGELQLPYPRSPETILIRVLSSKLIASSATTSSFPKPKQVKQYYIESVLCTIGFGQCGLVFEEPGKWYVVKVDKLVAPYADTFPVAFVAHFHLRQAFEQRDYIQCHDSLVFWYALKTSTALCERLEIFAAFGYGASSHYRAHPSIAILLASPPRNHLRYAQGYSVLCTVNVPSYLI